jgi:hypothetical protein
MISVIQSHVKCPDQVSGTLSSTHGNVPTWSLPPSHVRQMLRIYQWALVSNQEVS